jgi:hypothetical protein
MHARTKNILRILTILSYVAMFGYIVQFGSQLISVVVSFFNPDAAGDIYMSSLGLYDLRQHSVTMFLSVMSFVLILSAINAYIWYWVVRLLSNLNLQNPFSRKVAAILERIGFALLGIWIVSLIGDQFVHQLSKNTGFAIGRIGRMNEYLFIAGIVYIISQVFKRGVEMQEENELTI